MLACGEKFDIPMLQKKEVEIITTSQDKIDQNEMTGLKI